MFKMRERIWVPWFSQEEWEQVYHDIFSKDTERRRRGYERLLVWKTRCPQLPLGVECTLVLIQVGLEDNSIIKQINNGNLPVYAEYDLRLIYSTSIIRFLNHLSSIAQTEETLFSMAQKLNIPEWVVSLRHDTAHGSRLPYLSVFRVATNFCLNWLHENYWKTGFLSIQCNIVSQTSAFGNNSNIQDLFDIWQALKMYELTGNVLINDIPDETFRKLIKDILGQNNKKNVSEIENDTFEDIACVTSGRYAMSVKSQHRISFAVQKIMKKLLFSFQEYKDHKLINETIVSMLLGSQTFIPSPQLMERFRREDDEYLPKWLYEIWDSLLVSLQKSFSIFPVLVSKLIEHLNDNCTNSNQLVTALWIKQLCLSMKKADIALTRANEWHAEGKINSYISKSASQSTLHPTLPVPVLSKHVWNAIKDSIDSDYPDLKDMFFALKEDGLGNKCHLAALKLAVSSPCRFTNLYLSSLLDVVQPALSDVQRGCITDLVLLYTNGNNASSEMECGHKSTIYTVQDLTKTHGNLKIINENSSVEGQSLQSSDYDWSSCALGVLPWQKDSLPVLDMPCQWSRPTIINKEESDTFNIVSSQNIKIAEFSKKRKKLSKIGKKKRMQVKITQQCIEHLLNDRASKI